MTQKNIELEESRNGFSHRDMHSKAILNGDRDSLMKYKIQRNRMAKMNSTANEIQTIKTDVESLRSELLEIKNLLLQITAGSSKWQ